MPAGGRWGPGTGYGPLTCGYINLTGLGSNVCSILKVLLGPVLTVGGWLWYGDWFVWAVAFSSVAFSVRSGEVGDFVF